MALDIASKNRITKRKKFLWYLYPPYLFVIVLSLLAVAFYARSTFRSLYIDAVASDLRLLANVIANQLAADSSSTEDSLPNYQSISELLKNNSGKRLTIIAENGKVISDTYKDPLELANHLNRQEVKTALAGQIGQSERFSKSLLKQMLYVAVPARHKNGKIFVVRLSVPTTELDSALHSLNLSIYLATFFVAVLAGFLSWLIAKRVSRRIQQIQSAAEHFAMGEFDYRLEVPRSQELSRLANAMNTMAGQLDERIRTIVAQKNQLDAVLSGMSEAVIAFDLAERILFLNSAAERLFNVSSITTEGKTVTEAIRSSKIQSLVGTLIQTQRNLDADFEIHSNKERLIQVHGNVLHDDSGQPMGGLLVLDDVTELRRLENIRKDFVANVSHELRTPITSILGFVETLLSSQTKNPEDSKRFLEIVRKHANRLNSIIEDLLSLSRIEQQGKTDELIKEVAKIEDVVKSSINLCSQHAGKKNITIRYNCADNIELLLTPSLLEQALVNLIDNAIKYSEENSSIEINVSESGSEIILAVNDNGVGIPAEHLDRLFERFYRVDKARSRKVGGTGLGLSIVKHIAQAFGGYPTVSSTLGKGSTFQIHLPKHIKN